MFRQVLQYVTDLLKGNVGFLVNERFINIPAQITVPLLETLVTEMRKARDRNLPYDFQHYIMISKLYKTKNLINGTATAPDSQVCREGKISSLFWGLRSSLLTCLSVTPNFYHSIREAQNTFLMVSRWGGGQDFFAPCLMSSV